MEDRPIFAYDLCREAEKLNLLNKEVHYEEWLKYLDIEMNKYEKPTIRESGFFKFIEEFKEFFFMYYYLFIGTEFTGIKQTLVCMGADGLSQCTLKPLCSVYYDKHHKEILQVLLKSFQLAGENSDVE